MSHIEETKGILPIEENSVMKAFEGCDAVMFNPASGKTVNILDLVPDEHVPPSEEKRRKMADQIRSLCGLDDATEASSAKEDRASND